MAAHKGHKKIGGRQEGTKNKRTEQWEAFTDYCLTGGLQKFREELEKLNGKDYINAFNNMLEYHAPKLARSEVKVSGELMIAKNIIKLPDGTEISI